MDHDKLSPQFFHVALFFLLRSFANGAHFFFELHVFKLMWSSVTINSRSLDLNSLAR